MFGMSCLSGCFFSQVVSLVICISWTGFSTCDEMVALFYFLDDLVYGSSVVLVLIISLISKVAFRYQVQYAFFFLSFLLPLGMYRLVVVVG